MFKNTDTKTLVKIGVLLFILLIICIGVLSSIFLTACSSSSSEKVKTDDDCMAHIILENGTSYDVVVDEYRYYTESSGVFWIILTLKDGTQILTSIYNVYLYTGDKPFTKVLENNKR